MTSGKQTTISADTVMGTEKPSPRNREYLYRFTDEERALIDRRWRAYLSAVEVIGELHNLQVLGVPLSLDAERTGFLLPSGMEIKQGEQSK